MDVLLFLGWLGDIGVAAADATWKTIAIRTLERLAPLIALVLFGIMAVVSGALAYRVVKEMAELGRRALRDGRVAWDEAAVVAPVYVVGLAVAIVVAVLAWQFGLTTMDGLAELRALGGE